MKSLKWVLVLLSICALVAYGVLLIKPAWSHDKEHPENNWWLAQANSGRGPCCDGSDAVRVDDPDWIIVPDGKMEDGSVCRRTNKAGWNEDHGRYCVRLRVHPFSESDKQTVWFFVSDQAVVPPEQNKDGAVRVWPMTESNGGPLTVEGVRCFMPGAGT